MGRWERAGRLGAAAKRCGSGLTGGADGRQVGTAHQANRRRSAAVGTDAKAMALFTGTFENKVDRKGRVSLPADFRAELPEGGERIVYIYPSPRDDALEACDKAFMQRIVDSIEDAPLYSDEEDDLGATIVASARRAHLDETGRLVLPPDFAHLAGVADKAVFVGRGSRFQIWSPERFAEHAERARQRVKGRTLPLRPKRGDGEG